VIGVIAFPLVFESQPRPIPVDIPIEIPRKDGAPALVMPSARSPAAPAPAPTPPKPVVEDVKPETGVAPEKGSAASTTNAVPAAPVDAAPKPVVAPVPKAVVPEPVESPKKAAAPAAAPQVAAPAPATDAAKAKALLEGKPVAAKDAARFVVQVGAFADASAVQDTRAKLEKMGLKSFTQVTETASGSRTRVRLGPFATREEAERVLAKTKAGGVNGVVLTL
jgi:DedD protein